jgi:hypothetical protein
VKCRNLRLFRILRITRHKSTVSMSLHAQLLKSSILVRTCPKFCIKNVQMKFELLHKNVPSKESKFVHDRTPTACQYLTKHCAVRYLLVQLTLQRQVLYIQQIHIKVTEVVCYVSFNGVSHSKSVLIG